MMPAFGFKAPGAAGSDGRSAQRSMFLERLPEMPCRRHGSWISILNKNLIEAVLE